MKKIKIVCIKKEYIEYLHSIDNRVLKGDDSGVTKKYPYIGVLVERNNVLYYAPLQSPKYKYKNLKNNKKNVFKIKNGDYGIVSLINMIPVRDDVIISFNINQNNKTNKYSNLLSNQLIYLNKNKKELFGKAEYMIELSFENPDHYLLKHANNIQLLTNHYQEYEEETKKSQKIGRR